LVGRRTARRGLVLSAIGRVLRRALPRRRPSRPGAFWERWTSFVMGRPVIAMIASAAVLLVLAIPALSLKTGNGALRQFPAGNEVRAGFEAAAAQQGPGALTPINVIARPQRGSVDDPRTAAAVRELRGAIARDPLVARVAEPVAAGDRRSVLLVATARSDGENAATRTLVKRLRARLPAGTPLQVEVGGSPAGLVDFDHRVTGSLWKIALFVLSLSFLVLLMLLRSVVLPLKAVVMNLLTVGASLGVVVAVFQWGWVDGFLGFKSRGYVDTLTPPLVLAVVFGLSMDYEVFLLSRIKERYTATHDTRAAVAGGLSSSARTITSAALIMVVVFSVFVGTGLTSIQQIGLGNAVAIALDATLVRLVLVPASMAVLGAWNWWLPRPLARILGGAGRGSPLPSTQ
jgi:uncharacterized membrane protein YdfJ with MMPL/SSD domain